SKPGRTWSAPPAAASPGNVRVFWPWVAAGDAGKVSVVWYQTEPQDGMPDLDCQTGHVHAMEATILGATGKKPQKWTVDSAGRAVHVGWVCQGGTTCVVTGQDRRLGDYFTNALDKRGRVLIAPVDHEALRRSGGGFELAHDLRRELAVEEGDLVALRVVGDVPERVARHDLRELVPRSHDHRDLEAERVLDRPLDLARRAFGRG